MADCLGLYISDNLIKYAKMSKDGNEIKLQTSGVKAYSNLQETVGQIVSETDSEQIPLSINVDEEKYNFFWMSSLLNNKDLPKAISTEFESVCYDKNDNPNNYTTRYELMQDSDNENRLQVLHVALEKTKLNLLTTKFIDKKPSYITPIPVAITNILTPGAQENSIIVNIEDKTTVTTIIDGKIQNVKKIDSGMGAILDAINAKENSYAKAYEICKNTTIYTMQSQEISSEENEHMADIVPVLFEIGTKLKNIISENNTKVSKIYLTGAGVVVNNIDYYFNEILESETCEILKPFFAEDDAQINVKDYIEVNSATALALQGLGMGLKNINFGRDTNTTWNKIKKILTMEVGGSKSKAKKKNKGNKESKGLKDIKLNINLNLITGKVSLFVKYLFFASLMAFVTYSILSVYTVNEIKSKQKQIEKVISNTNNQIALIQKDTTALNKKITEYTDLTKNLQDAKAIVDENNSYKNSIPVLLSEIMRIIPKGVQLTSVENPTGKKIIINAQANKYEQLAYFKAELRSEGVLKPDTVVSSQAVKTNSKLVKIVIEGELP